MALVKCHECGNDVSTEAKTCPKCGAKVVLPKPPKRPTSRFAKIVGGVLLAVLFVARIITAGEERKEAERQASAAQAEQQRRAALTPEQRKAEDEAIAKRQAAEDAKHLAAEEAKTVKAIHLHNASAGATALKRASKDPDTFELKSAVLHSNGTACYDYRAKNSFGAMLAGSAVLTTKGKILVQEVNGNAFAKVWNMECTKADGEEIVQTLKRLDYINAPM
ncbi:MAG: zinc ribbon domain-containing protein [Betaproteobacteria bacterium]|nr:zinc ribbon domain-containing protein [Betaproteobacteria bacterium]